LPAHGDVTAAPRNRNRENVAVSCGIHLFGPGDHAGYKLAFWCRFLSTASSCCGLPAFSALLARPRLVNLGVFPHTNPGHTVFRLFSACSVCTLRRGRAVGTTAQGNPVCFRTFSAYSLLPRLSAGEHVSRRCAILCWRCRCPAGWGLNL